MLSDFLPVCYLTEKTWLHLYFNKSMNKVHSMQKKEGSSTALSKYCFFF
jgi:hypothetical protein